MAAKSISIDVQGIKLVAELCDTPTARRIWDLLPLEGSVHVWGDEIYFDIPLDVELEPGARAEVQVGELGYWPEGPAFCAFFGPTPVSTDENPRAFSPVNVFGRIAGDATVLKAVSGGTAVRVSKSDPR